MTPSRPEVRAQQPLRPTTLGVLHQRTGTSMNTWRVSQQLPLPLAQDRFGRLHTRSAIDQTPQPFADAQPLVCASCGVPVSAVPTHTRMRTNGRIEVTAHFALRGQPHRPRCAYDWEAVVRDLVQSSRGALVHTERQFVLHLIDLSKVDEMPAVRLSQLTRAATAMLDDASRVVRALELFANDILAVRQFQVVYADRGQERVLPWSRVFYQASTDLSRLLRDLRNHRRPRPRLVHGTIRTVRRVGNVQVLEFNEFAPRVRRPIRVRVQSPHPLAFARAKSNKCVLAYGVWRIAVMPEATELRLDVPGPWALTYW